MLSVISLLVQRITVMKMIQLQQLFEQFLDHHDNHHACLYRMSLGGKLIYISSVSVWLVGILWSWDYIDYRCPWLVPPFELSSGIYYGCISHLKNGSLYILNLLYWSMLSVVVSCCLFILQVSFTLIGSFTLTQSLLDTFSAPASSYFCFEY